MSIEASYIVDRRDPMCADEFTECYVKPRRPVLLKRALAGCSALSSWSLEHLRRSLGQSVFPLKSWTTSGLLTSSIRFEEYADQLEAHDRDLCESGSNGAPLPAYLHDIPLKKILPDADDLLEAFPAQYFPAWYRPVWSNFAQFFLGPAGSVTPLHFDCLLTHNLFFQVSGRKRFTLIAPEQLSYCYPVNWRWCEVDVEQPDFNRHPDYRQARPVEVELGPGDGLYFPPGTLHHVRSLDCAMSFNVDWHTKDSAASGLMAFTRGMPRKNLYYNALIALGLWLCVPPNRLYPYYRSYLDYVS